MTAERFAFGENWADYIERNFSEERVEISRKHLLNFLRLSDLKGRVFLDIGCGSGLHSLAALQAGASKIISFDYDESSVATTRKLHEWAGSPRHWTIDQGSVLDRAYMVALPKADVVYSWGVLHHTGEMWTAVENAAIPLASDGIFYIAALHDRRLHRPHPRVLAEDQKALQRVEHIHKAVYGVRLRLPRLD